MPELWPVYHCRTLSFDFPLLSLENALTEWNEKIFNAGAAVTQLCQPRVIGANKKGVV